MHDYRPGWGRKLTWAVPVLLLLQGGCGDDVSGPGNGNGGTDDHGPFKIIDIGLRPQAIQRASSLAGTLPNPHIAYYNLSAFYGGGQPGATFTWHVNPAMGCSLEPKTPELGLQAATVVLRSYGRAPLGVYEIAVDGTSGTETSSFSKRFAVVEHNWMKHQRAVISNPNDPPASLVLDPMYAPLPGGGDEIYFVTFPNPEAVDVWSIAADRPYTAGTQVPTKSFFIPRPCNDPSQPCPPGTVNPAPEVPPQEFGPDLSPAALGRDEILFSSQMDVHFQDRANTLSPRTPFSLWVVRRPTPSNPNFARVITFDVVYECIGGQRCYRAWDYRLPRWDPSPPRPERPEAARIAFLANISDTLSIFLGDLVDRNMDTRSDTLDNIRRLPKTVGAASYDWHPDGRSIYFTAGTKGIHKLDVASGALQTLTFTHLDSLITNFAWVSVYKGQMSPTLLAFQAASENRVHLYVYEVETDTLLRVNPFGFPINLNLFPRWHPTRKEIVYVSDYNVSLWLGSNDPPPVGDPDPLGQLRTATPSVWTVRLQ